MRESGDSRSGLITMVAVGAGLLAFGILYDRIVGWIEREHPYHGHTADQVVFGTAVTLVGISPLIGLRATAMAFYGFACSGAAMWLGSKIRYMRMSQIERQTAIEIARRLGSVGDVQK